MSESSVRDTLAVLRRVQLFRGLDDEHLQQIADASKFRESQPNEVLARRGEIGQEMFVIVDVERPTYGAPRIINAYYRKLLGDAGEHFWTRSQFRARIRMSFTSAVAKVYIGPIYQ